MATLTVDKRSGKVVGYSIQWYDGKRRQTIYLSSRKYRQKTAERFKEMVETLIYYRSNEQIVPDKTVANWLATAPADLQEKLARVGLISVTKQRTCQELWDTFLKQKTDVKPCTIKAYRQCRGIFFRTFSPNELVEKVTTDRLLDWKTMLLEGFSIASVAGHLKSAKAVFNWAVRQEWLTKSPMSGIPRGSFINRENDRIISMEEYAKLLNACPNQEWRSIVALARIGGLRCPSELKRLRWSDINWAENRFLVRASKTERHEKHRERIVPLFSELRVVLKQHFSLVETEGNEFVIQHYQGSSWSVSNPIQNIARRAGLGTLVRPFDNMRMSRSNEVLARWGEIKESMWIGHTVKVMIDHYLRLSDSDYSEAADESSAGTKAEETSMDSQDDHAKSHAKEAEQDGLG